MAQGRSLWGEILQNFISSLKPRKFWGELKGRDYLGTEYYESQRGPQGLNRPSRWFAPAKENDFEQKIPPEWEAWLRYRRKDPPTEEEVQTNLLKMRQRIEKAKKLEKPNPVISDEISNKPTSSFPVYGEYSINPENCQEKNK